MGVAVGGIGVLVGRGVFVGGKGVFVGRTIVVAVGVPGSVTVVGLLTTMAVP
jgi:hypothetical protein